MHLRHSRSRIRRPVPSKEPLPPYFVEALVRCFPLFHAYGKWTDRTYARIERRPSLFERELAQSQTNPQLPPQIITGSFIEQERRCTRCGKVQLRTAKAEI